MNTLFDKIWDRHVVDKIDGLPALIYIDRHLIHEATSPQAFDGVRQSNRTVRRPDLTVATMDHVVPTSDDRSPLDEKTSLLMETLKKNCRDFNIPLYQMEHERQGIVHVIGPELGLTLPGLTIVCGDSHTSTHGAFGTFAFGIGTSEVEHVLATQCLRQEKPKQMAVQLTGTLPHGTTAKDIILRIIGKIGVAGGQGHVIEYRGEAVSSLSMEERMTVCNMSIECGARAGMMAPDETTFSYLKGRPFAPKGEEFERAVEDWKSLRTDAGASYDRTVSLDVSELEPQVTWGTTPGQVTNITDSVPDPSDFDDPSERNAAEQALRYMGLDPGRSLAGIELDRVFIGSCTNARLEDLRRAGKIVEGKTVADSVRAMVVPGSTRVKQQAEKEGLDDLFRDAGFEWRQSGCSMCLGMNPDVLDPKQRCASTSNRNFEGRQGREGRTHLMSPEMAAASAVTGQITDVREFIE